jgi:hypothetical protein
VQCPGCGFKWETELQIRMDDLVEVQTETQIRAQRKAEMLAFLQVHRQRSYLEGAAPTWTENKFRREFGCSADLSWYRGLIFGDHPTREDQVAYQNYLGAIAQRQGKPIAWVIEQFQHEFGIGSYHEAFVR